MERAIWVGPLVHHDDQSISNALSPAANTWQSNFIEGLNNNNIKVTCLTYLPNQVWPRGKLWVKYPNRIVKDDRLDIIYVDYLNLLILRDFIIPIVLFVKCIIKGKIHKYNFVFTYNPSLKHRLLVKLLKKAVPIKWYSIVADDIAWGSPDLSIFLSYGYYQRYRDGDKYFLDGGVPQNNKQHITKFKNDKKILLYAGAINKWTGIIEFCHLFNEISYKYNIELHIYGKGKSEIIESYATQNCKIKNFGFVTNEFLDQACENAYAFINPRPTKIALGENNFPSKLLMYLSYNKPIISTKTEGLSPVYANLLMYYDEKESLLKRIDTILNSVDTYDRFCEKIRVYSNQNTWTEKVKALLSN